jgi:arabinofuranosyltransferase
VRFPALRVSPSTQRHLARAAYFAPAAFLLVMAFERRWMDDDGFINLRVVRNLLQGAGPVFNVDERVEAVTSPLWIGILAALGALGIRLEYAAVSAGIALTVGAVLLAERAASRLDAERAASRLDAERAASRLDGAAAPASDRPWNVPLPLGMAVFVAVPAAWDYASSGLETGLALAWLGASFGVIVRRICREPSAPPSLVSDVFESALVGLGPLIRPELALYAAAPLAVVAWTSGARPGATRSSKAIAVAVVGLSACAIPAAYEIFRMGYYGSTVPNTAIAKEAFLSRYSQGRCYFDNFFGTYAMGWPLLVSDVFESALVHVGYIVRIGGDYMHARMFIPPLFAGMMPIAMVPAGLPSLASHKYGKALVFAAAAVVVGWLPVCIGWLRVGVDNVCGIGDERGWYAREAKVDHPVVLASYVKHSFYQDANKVERLVEKRCSRTPLGGPQHGSDCRVLQLDEKEQKELGPTGVSFPLAGSVDPRIGAVFSGGAIGISGYLLPPSVHLLDRHGLADPLVAHSELGERGRPGHEKTLPAAWAVARFTAPAPVEDAAVAAARRALQCGALADLQRAGQGPMTAGAFFENVKHAWTNGALRIPRDPFAAEARFCGGTLPPDVSAGGNGGRPLRWQCPAGYTVSSLLGAFAAKEKAVSGLQPTCRGPVQGAGPVTGAKLGEGTDGPFEATCPAGETAIGVHGHADHLVRSFGVVCASAEGTAYSAEGGLEVGANSGAPFEVSCPEGEALVGVTGRSGALVDRVGILCGAR